MLYLLSLARTDKIKNIRILGINKNITKMQNRQDLLNSFIINTKFYDYIRNKLNGNLSSQELKELLAGIESIVRYKVQIVPSSLPRPVYMVVVYGEMEINGVTTTKGEYIRLQETTDTFDIYFLKPTTLVLVNLQVLEFRIEEIKSIREKMKTLQICMPIKQLKLTISETRKVAKILQIRQINVKYSEIPKEPGFFLFSEGIFQICTHGIPALEMESNFIEITEPFQFTVRLKNNFGKYGFIPRQSLYDLLAPDALIQLQKIWKLRQGLKDMNKGKRDYMEAAERLREKMRKKMKQNKKLSLNEKSTFETTLKENLETSRRLRLQKCSTAFTTLNSFSVDSAKKTASTLYNSKTLYSVSSPIKQKQSVRYQKTEDKLNKMRTYSLKKSKTKLEKDWYHLDEDKMQQTLSMSYFKIKTEQKNEKQMSTMCNYKRVHKIYSDPCFKKCLTFRSY